MIVRRVEFFFSFLFFFGSIFLSWVHGTVSLVFIHLWLILLFLLSCMLKSHVNNWNIFYSKSEWDRLFINQTQLFHFNVPLVLFYFCQYQARMLRSFHLASWVVFLYVQFCAEHLQLNNWLLILTLCADLASKINKEVYHISTEVLILLSYTFLNSNLIIYPHVSEDYT